MATYNPSSFQIFVSPETVVGSTNATPAFSQIQHKAGATLNTSHDWLQSDLIRPKMSSSGGDIVNLAGKFSIDTQLHRGTAIDTFFESLLSGKFVSNVLTAGDVPNSFTLEEKQMGQFIRQRGAHVNSGKIDIDKNGNVDFSIEGMSFDNNNFGSVITGATYSSAIGRLLTGRLVTNLNIAGLGGVNFTKISINITADREVQKVLGSETAIGMATSARNIEMELTAYRSGFDIEAISAAGTATAVSIDIGTGADGYRFSFPAMKFKFPESEKDKTNSWVKASAVADFDATTGCDMKITKLA